MSRVMLELQDVCAFYGLKQVLYGVSLAVERGEVVTLIGRNGMGKTTTIRAIIGFTPPKSGFVRFEGTEIAGAPPYRIARLGIGLVPEGRQIFHNLTVHENLIATAHAPAQSEDPWTALKIYGLFPRLAERRRSWGWQLSGGEQQMLAIGRALMTNPRLLILDEATEGIAPLIREEIWRCLYHVKSLGQAILVVDKNLDALLKLADRHYILERGLVVWHGTGAELRAQPHIYEAHLGV